MELSTFLSFCLASFLMALMPGPDNIFVITESLSKGSRNGILLSLGLNSGVLVHTLAAATGVSLILRKSEIAFSFLQYAGVAYLLYLAYLTFKEKAEPPDSKTIEEQKKMQLFKTGITMNLLNPKVSLFFIAFLPQFVSEGTVSPIWQMIVMGIAFMIIGFVVFSSLALLASQLRELLKSDAFWKTIKWVKFSVLILIATLLIIE